MNKFGNVATSYGGVVYASKFEARYARELDLRVKAKDIKKWESQVKMPIVVNGKKICTYIIDFLIIHNDGKKEYIEVKGMMTSTASLKIKLFRALHPDLILTVVRK